MSESEQDETRTMKPAPHNDGPTGRPERHTGAGQEATQGTRAPEEHDEEHRSGYGGKGGAPDSSSDKRP
jgi:hypothetical protein